MITATVIADSVSPHGPRITTLALEYPRFIHPEFLTHRAFNRGSASTRAIPTRKLIERVVNNPVIPTSWGKNQPGMQASSELPDFLMVEAETAWRDAAKAAAAFAADLVEIGVHKQIAGRILEPFLTIQTIVTATEWDNFFSLRLAKDENGTPLAQPEMFALASAMKTALSESIPMHLGVGEWHLPYVTASDRTELETGSLKMVSAARCARVSYVGHDGVPNVTKDLELSKKLITDRHSGPFEHQATPGSTYNKYANLWGWKSFRYQLGI